ncbi:MAG TPA: HtaA domain-containing protein [Solirubrobacterales bacterium]|nr:HtaA domain-containing protein [Solirubrobacterales bacterium]
MSWNLNKRSAAAALLAVGALALAALEAPQAGAAVAGSGQVTIAVAKHSKGRTLSGQGVKLVAGGGTAGDNGKLTLPISSLDPIATQASATSDGSLRFKHGKRAVGLSGLSFDLAAQTLDGKLGGKQMPVFKLGAAASVDPGAGSIALREGKLQLTADAAKALKEKLGLGRALIRKGVGMIWLSAQASPTHAAAQAVVSGSAQWGVLTSWRAYVLGNFGPGSVGTITTDEGATANGTLSAAGAYFEFPAASGSFERGLYGAADVLSLKAAGSVTFAKPGHCIIEIKFSDLRLKLDGANSSIALDALSDIDAPEGMTCADVPAVTTNDVLFAKLDLSGVTPSYSGDGKTVSWSSIPAALTAAGGSAWGAGYAEGQALDPVTITVGLG